jgi:hypothetical protein
MLRATLCRFHVTTKSLSQLLHVASTLQRKIQASGADTSTGQIQPNIISQVVFEILADGLRLKARVPAGTLASILEVGEGFLAIEVASAQ